MPPRTVQELFAHVRDCARDVQHVAIWAMLPIAVARESARRCALRNVIRVLRVVAPRAAGWALAFVDLGEP